MTCVAMCLGGIQEEPEPAPGSVRPAIEVSIAVASNALPPICGTTFRGASGQQGPTQAADEEGGWDCSPAC